MSMPRIELKRLILRGFTLNDGENVREMAGDKKIAKTTLNIPHPYEKGVAEKWIATHQENYKKNESLTLAITDKSEHFLIGTIGLKINEENETGELGYWVGTQYWNLGYCTESAAGIIQYGFEKMKLHRIYAGHFKNNPASGRVMSKIGMQKEGVLRQHVKKWNNYEDLVCYGIIIEEFYSHKFDNKCIIS